MGRQTKASKKFAPKIKGEIERRRERQKIHQRRNKNKKPQDSSNDVGKQEEENTQTEVSTSCARLLITQLAQHKEELEALRETQKEFFEFLEKEDSNLLHFDDAELEEDDESEEDEFLSMELLQSWKEGAATSVRKSLCCLLTVSSCQPRGT